MNYNDFEFQVIENHAVLFAYHGEERNLVIPDEYEGYPVTKVNLFLFCDNCEIFETIVFPKYLESFKSINFSQFINLKKITFLNEKTNLKSCSFNHLGKLEEISLSAWKYLSSKQILKLFIKKLDVWDKVDNEEQKQILSTIDKSYNITKALFLSENSKIVSFLIQHKINIDLYTINEFLDYYNPKEMPTITAMLLEYKNNNFSKEFIEETKKNDELVEIGLQLPTLKQLKKKWTVVEVDGGLQISGYNDKNTTEIIPTGTIDGDLIEGLTCSPNNNFEPIENLIIDAQIKTIGQYTFQSEHTLTTIKLPSSLEKINNHAFDGCVNLIKIEVPESVTSISRLVFNECKSLKKAVLPSVTFDDYDSGVFLGCESLTDITLNNNITVLPYGFLSNCKSLTSINIPNSVIKISNRAFNSCIKLNDIKLPENLEVIGELCFENCASLEKITFPKTLKSVENGAFRNCKNLKIVEVNSQVKFAKSVFNGCPNVKFIRK